MDRGKCSRDTHKRGGCSRDTHKRVGTHKRGECSRDTQHARDRPALEHPWKRHLTTPQRTHLWQLARSRQAVLPHKCDGHAHPAAAAAACPHHGMPVCTGRQLQRDDPRLINCAGRPQAHTALKRRQRQAAAL
eukprot:351853-Chlamydomonas_euryale.AAC.5